MITNEDLTKEISTQQLKQLSDIDGTGEINQDVIDDALGDALSFVESFIVLPESPTPLLKKIVVDLTIYELKRKNDLVSDSDKELKKENEAYLSKMSNGKLKTTITSPTDTATVQGNRYAFRHGQRKYNTKGFR